MSVKKKEVTVKVDGVETRYFVKTPNANELTRAQIESNKVFRMALENGSLVRSKLNDYLKDNGLWDDAKQKQVEKMAEEIYAKEKILAAGGIKRSEAKSICLAIRELRAKQAILLYNQRQYDLFTADAQAENARFDYLVSCCSLDSEGNKLFENLDDYKNKAEEEYASACASKLAELINGYDPDWQKKLPENQFLVKNKFTDEELRFLNKEGKFVDSEGRPIDEDGNYIDEKGNHINRDGVAVDEEGNIKMEFVPLIDDE